MGNLIPNMAWEDVVFEGRNKDYGAYRIRYEYPRHLTFSAIFVISLFLSIIVGHQLLSEKLTQRPSLTSGDVIPIVNPIKPPDIAKDPVPKPTGLRYTVPKVTVEDVKTNQMPAYNEIRDLVDNSITDKPIAAIEDTKEMPITETLPPVTEVAKVVEPVPDVVKNPEFSGGMVECAKWLSRHLEYPAMAVRMGIEGKVVVEFTVDENGKISDATILESLHRLCDQEAIRLVKSMPAWTPGEKNGVKTTQKYTLPIRFVLQ
jgi:periplasmic protein TonB